jgi:hypothetical protein
MDRLTTINTILNALASLVTIVGLPIAIATFRTSKRKEAIDREYGTYNSLDERYIEFVKFALDHIELDVFELGLVNPPALDDFKKHQQLAAYSILMSIMERAYLMYADQPGAAKRNQWHGWHQFISNYCARISFREAWIKNGDGFDDTFTAYITTTLSSQTSSDA